MVQLKGRYVAVGAALVLLAGCSSDSSESAPDDTAVIADLPTGAPDVPATGTGNDAANDVATDVATGTDAVDGSSEADVVVPGSFGAPCETNSECASSFCVEGQAGFICTEECIDSCPEGFSCKGLSSSGGSDLLFLCLPRLRKACTLCADDLNCPGGACIDVDGEKRCAPTCDGPTDCPGGYTCTEMDDPDGKTSRCLPTTGSCSCFADYDGGKRSCSKLSELGVCFGVEDCDPTVGWLGCSALEPTMEQCNGVDDDCNGLLDDGLEEGGACTNDIEGVGSCTGTRVCAGSAGWVCQGPQPAAETCDYKDNDCDGVIDEDFKDLAGNRTTTADCGSCGNDCTGRFPHATGRCGGPIESPLCVVDTCDTDYFRLNDFQCALPNDASCQPCVADSDCSGGTCTALDGQNVCVSACGAEAKACADGFMCQAIESGAERCLPVTKSCVCNAANGGQTRACAVTNTVGTCYGGQTCDPTVGWTTCSARTPAAEQCNGLDDDCNGQIDEGVTPPAEPCEKSNVFGTCAGTWLCAADGPSSAWWCSAKIPSDEVCNYEDDDCDGQVDELFQSPTGVKYVSDAHCGACGAACDGLLPNAVAYCAANDGKPQCQVLVCDPGYYQAGPLACLPVNETLCTPCQSDANCSTPGDKCIPLDGANFCVWDCSASNLHGSAAGQCPTGYACEAQGGSAVCVPSTGSCSCISAKDNGDIRTCVNAGPTGSCYGQQACDATAGWSACNAAVPAPELCDGKDNDCNALIDDVADRGQPCSNTNEFGTCPGVGDCTVGSTALACVGPAPSEERCDYKDDDCDGLIDEGFDGLLSVCSRGDGACKRFGYVECAANGLETRCNAAVAAPSAEMCDGLDNDCNGQTDEGPLWSTRGTVCNVGVGVCAGVGVLGCDSKNPAGPLVCSAVSGAGTAEVCDGLDNDCNGKVDDGATWTDKGTVCTVGKGVCQRAGIAVCNPSAPQGPTICSVTAGAPLAELCDNLDNNCDGSTDEAWADKGTVCTVGVGACQKPGVKICNPSDPTKTLCNATAGTASTEVCDSLDNNCNGSTDEGWLVGGKYTTDAACGNCFTDCTTIYAKPHAHGICATSGTATCEMKCCRAGDTNPACDGGNWVDANQIPNDGCEFFQDPDAIYVSGADVHALDGGGCGRAPYDAGVGTYPCRTIAGGLAEAVSAGRSKVLVASAAYNESVTLVAGKKLMGGYNPTNWTRDISTNLTAIFGSTTTGSKKTVIAKDLNSAATLFEGFVVYGESAAGTGESSYGIWVSNCNSSLTIQKNIVWAGYGGPGAAGTSGVNGTSGTNGGNGKDAYEPAAKYACGGTCAGKGADNGGGAPGSQTCGGVDISGGAGGVGDCPDWDEAWNMCAGCPVGNPGGTQTVTTGGKAAPSGGGAGGAGGCDSMTSACFAPSCTCFAPAVQAACPNGAGSLDGANGPSGTNGAGGAGCTNTSALGTVTAGEWAGGVGTAGVVGTPGRGGGGGGAGGGVEGNSGPSCSNGASDIGGSGGGGGSGGCAATQGSPAASGGGSFAIFVSWTTPVTTTPVITNNELHRGVGGPGGRGGNGGTGGAGGHGGVGGKGGQNGTTFWCAGAGSKGGEGGEGGHGGGGGGGCGGASYGLFVAGASPAAWKTDNVFAVGGSGGPGGAGGGSGAGGLTGTSGVTGASGSSNF